jgi:hypothetical protein
LQLTERLSVTEPDAAVLTTDTDVILQVPPAEMLRRWREEYGGRLVVGGNTVRGADTPTSLPTLKDSFHSLSLFQSIAIWLQCSLIIEVSFFFSPPPLQVCYPVHAYCLRYPEPDPAEYSRGPPRFNLTRPCAGVYMGTAKDLNAFLWRAVQLSGQTKILGRDVWKTSPTLSDQFILHFAVADPQRARYTNMLLDPYQRLIATLSQHPVMQQFVADRTPQGEPMYRLRDSDIVPALMHYNGAAKW